VYKSGKKFAGSKIQKPISSYPFSKRTLLPAKLNLLLGLLDKYCVCMAGIAHHNSITYSDGFLISRLWMGTRPCPFCGANNVCDASLITTHPPNRQYSIIFLKPSVSLFGNLALWFLEFSRFSNIPYTFMADCRQLMIYFYFHCILEYLGYTLMN
jgi:hypothetical protein